jgi:hypothetical protein
MSSDPRISTFADFWTFYLGEHSKPATRALHLAGSTAGLVCLAVALVLGRPVFILAGLVIGYALAWTAHFFVEHNRPATFRYPAWSFAADWKMWAYALTGRLGGELAKAGVRPPPG